MCHYESIGRAMKAVTVLVLVSGLASALALEPIPFKLREITENSNNTLPGPRIYGGTEAQEGQFPFMVFVIIRTSPTTIYSCSASLIRKDLVLLAAHCVRFPKLLPVDVIMIAGKANLMPYVRERLQMDYYKPIDEIAFGLQERRAKKIRIHPGFSESTLHHDVALLELDEPFDWRSTVQTISVATVDMTSKTRCTILGWGLTRGNLQSYKLNFVRDRWVSTTKLGCLAKSSGPFICLKPSDSGICQGDSGSPLVCDGKVWGVASHFVSESLNPDCGDSFEEYYSELYPDLGMLKPYFPEWTGGGAYKSSTSIACLLLCLLTALWSGKN